MIQMGVSKNNGTPKSSILIGFSIINHPFGGTPIIGNTQNHPRTPSGMEMATEKLILFQMSEPFFFIENHPQDMDKKWLSNPYIVFYLSYWSYLFTCKSTLGI